jgi:hypothetical protein
MPLCRSPPASCLTIIPRTVNSIHSHAPRRRYIRRNSRSVAPLNQPRPEAAGVVGVRSARCSLALRRANEEPNRQEMCGALITDPLGLGAKRAVRKIFEISMPSCLFLYRSLALAARSTLRAKVLLLRARFARTGPC